MRVVIVAMIITAYVPGAGPPNGGLYGSHCHRAQCTRIRIGHAACGPSYRYHTVFVVDGVAYECVDRGGAITDERLDLVAPSLRSAFAWGVRRKQVEVWPPGAYWKFQRELKRLN